MVEFTGRRACFSGSAAAARRPVSQLADQQKSSSSRALLGAREAAHLAGHIALSAAEIANVRQTIDDFRSVTMPTDDKGRSFT